MTVNLNLNLATWPSKAEAAKLLGISERTLDRMIKLRSYPEVRMRPRPGLKSEPVVNPDDVQRLLDGRQVTAVMPTATGGAVEMFTAAFMRGFELAAGQGVAPVPRAPDKLWLTLKEASSYAGLSMALLQRLASKGRITALKDNGWKIHRRSLDEEYHVLSDGNVARNELLTDA